MVGVLGAVLVQQGRVQRRDTRSYTRPSLVAFVVIKTGRSYYVSDLGESNEGDSTYYFDKDISFVITCPVCLNGAVDSTVNIARGAVLPRPYLRERRAAWTWP